MRTAALALALALVTPLAAAAQQSAGARARLVITPAELAQHVGDPDIVLLHVGDRKTYDAGHIRGARYVSPRDDLSATGEAAHDLTLQMPPAGALRDTLAALGISNRSWVIVVQSDDYWSPSARVVFTLDYAGLDRVSWLDGGQKAWVAAGQPLTTDVPAATTGDLSPLHVRPTIVDAAFVEAHEHAPGFAIVDARNPEFYDGRRPAGARGYEKSGHIPGAVNVPFDAFVAEGSRLRATDEIAAVFARAGVKPGDTVVAYCHIGQQATATLMGARLAGHPVLLYDGSFEDWSKRNLPVDVTKPQR